MNEISSVIRLKDRIIIAILMSVFALLIATTAGVVAIVTKDNPSENVNGGNGGTIVGGNGDLNNHTHTYKEYYLTKNAEGKLDFVGVCGDASCQNPVNTWYIEGGIEEVIKVNSTCCTLGEKVYYFTSPFDMKTYTFVEQIPFGPHDYVGEIVTVEGVSSINVRCSRENCTEPAIVADNILDLKFERSEAATCVSDRRDYYTCTVNGEKITVSTYVESDDALLHYLNGKLISEYYIYDDVVKYGTEGIKINGDITIVGCGSWTLAAYICDECGLAQPAIVGNPPHSFDYDNILISKYPDFTQAGEAKLKCNNEGCTYEAKITLPKAIEDGNSVSLRVDEENKKQTWKYTYTPEGYDYTFSFEFDTPWEHDHQYEFDSTKTKNPTIYRDGEFIVKCTLCDQEKKHTLPKINEGVNATVISEATEQKPKTYEYTYVSETYSFTLVLEIEVGDKLSHSYVYELVPYGDGFALAGHCKNESLGCDAVDVVTDIGLTPEKEYVSPTCSQWGTETWYYVKDEVRYELSLPIPPEAGLHSFVCDATNTIYPTFENAGKAIFVCSGEGCGVTTSMITLPKAVIGSNASVDEATRQVKYTVNFKHDGVDFKVTVEYPLTDEHNHSYTYELVPMENADIGKFNFVGSCTYPLCTAKTTESDVKAELIEDNSTCTTGIKQLWKYEKGGKAYYCNLDIWVPDGHHMDYVPNSPTTVNPTLTECGSIEIHCTKCGETYILELPPINDPSVIAEITRETERQISYSYVYHYVYNEFDPDGFLDIDLIILISK